MYRISIIDKLTNIEEIPTMLTIALEIDRMTQQKDTSALDISELIKLDPSLTGKILKISNSALYAGSQRIVSLQQAIARLGFKEIRKIALSIAIINSFKNSFIDYEKFWIHSIATAYIAMNLSKKSKNNMNQDEIFSAALLHDTGILILDQYFGGLYKKVFDIAVKKKFDLQIVEQKILGITHAEVAAVLLKKWRLPDAIIDVILHHHAPQKSRPENLKITEYIYLANFIANNRGIDNGTGFFPEQFYDDIWEHLNLSVNDIPAILEEITDELDNARELLRIGGK